MSVITCQNSYRFRAIWSWKYVEFEKNRSIAIGPGDSPIKNCFGSIEDLPIDFNCTEGIFASQDSYGFTATYANFEQEKKVKFFSWIGRVPIEKTVSVRLKPYLYTSIWPFKIFGVKTLMGVERCEDHFLAIFWVYHKVFTCCLENHEPFTRRHLSENFC